MRDSKPRTAIIRLTDEETDKLSQIAIGAGFRSVGYFLECLIHELVLKDDHIGDELAADVFGYDHTMDFAGWLVQRGEVDSFYQSMDEWEDLRARVEWDGEKDLAPIEAEVLANLEAARAAYNEECKDEMTFFLMIARAAQARHALADCDRADL